MREPVKTVLSWQPCAPGICFECKAYRPLMAAYENKKNPPICAECAARVEAIVQDRRKRKGLNPDATPKIK